VRRREDRRPLRVADREIEEPRHPLGSGEPRVEPVDDHEVHVRMLGGGASDHEDRREAEQQSHPPRVDRRAHKS